MRTPIMASALIFLLALAGCNTTEGVGEDLQSAGKEVEKAADKAK